MKVADLAINNEKPSVDLNTPFSDVILEISSKRLGMTAVIDAGKIVGVITDGDLRRLLSKGDISHLTAQEMMGKNPKTIEADSLAIDAMEMMKKNNITQIIVTHENNYTGVIHLHDLIKEGII